MITIKRKVSIMHATNVMKLLLGVAVLLSLEAGAETMLQSSIHGSSGNFMKLVGGISLYAAVGVAFWLVLKFSGSNLTVTNALWQTTNIVVITLIGVLAFGNALRPIEWIGVLLAVIASICFVIPP